MDWFDKINEDYDVDRDSMGYRFSKLMFNAVLVVFALAFVFWFVFIMSALIAGALNYH